MENKNSNSKASVTGLRIGVGAVALKYIALFVFGGIGYYAIELLWRGHSHWTMALCGGLCLLAMYGINRSLPETPLLFRAFFCASVITAVEFAVGCIVNLWLGWEIWDYHSSPFNLLGQICLPFSFLWFLLSIPVCLLFDLLYRSHLRKADEKTISEHDRASVSEASQNTKIHKITRTCRIVKKLTFARILYIIKNEDKISKKPKNRV